MGMDGLEAASRRVLVPPVRVAPGAGCSAPDSARLHSRECYRPEDTKAGKHLRVEVQTTSCPQKPGRKLPDRSVCATLRDFPRFSLFYPPGLGSKEKAQSRGNSGACAAVSLPEMTVMPTTRAVAAWPGQQSPKEPIGAWGDFSTKLRHEMASSEVRRLEAAPRAPARYPRPGPALAAPHHIGGAAAVPAAGLGFRNGKVHVP